MQRLSVIIPAYQAAATIRRAVDSALGQTLPPHEVVVCDDGSTDGLVEALVGYPDLVRVNHQSNQGLSAARNSACRTATGDWLVLLDADDEWLPRRLERISAAIDADPTVDIVTTDALCRTPGRPDTRWYAQHSFPPREEPAAILDDGAIFAGAAIRRSAFERVGGFTVGLPHDSEWELWCRLLLSGSHARLVPEALAIYHVHDGPRLSQRRSAHYRMGIAVYQRLKGRYGAEVDETIDRLILREERRLAIAEGVDAVRNGDRVGCLRAAVARQMPAGMRPRFALAAVAPGLASNVLDR